MALQAYYPMNHDFNDYSGKSRHGTSGGAVINNVGQKLGSGCGEFGGDNDIVNFPTYFNPSGLTKYSIDGWIKNIPGIANRAIFTQWDGSGGMFLQSAQGTDGLLFGVGDGTGFGQVALATTSLTYFSAVFDGSLIGDINRLKIYVSASQQTLAFNGTIPAVFPTISVAPVMGGFALISRFWWGLIDDLAIYDHALDQDWIDWRWNGGAGRELSISNRTPRRTLLLLNKRKRI